MAARNQTHRHRPRRTTLAIQNRMGPNPEMACTWMYLAPASIFSVSRCMLFLDFVGGVGEVGNAHREFEGRRNHVAVEYPALTRHRRDAGDGLHAAQVGGALVPGVCANSAGVAAEGDGVFEVQIGEAQQGLLQGDAEA